MDDELVEGVDSVKFARINGEIAVLGTNAAMKVLLDQAKREQLADFIVHGHDGKQVFSRPQIKARIQKVMRRMAEKLI